MPKGVIEKINQLARNFLWGGQEDYIKIPYISWEDTCKPKKNGGLGLKNLAAWNTACIAKLVWNIAVKKDQLWIKWVHHKYLKNVDWWTYKPKSDCSWYWRKIIKVRDKLQPLFLSPNISNYTVTMGYKWLLGEQHIYKWPNAIWARAILPRHSFVAWVFMNQKLPVLVRLARFSPQIYPVTCVMCGEAEEDQNHLFYTCSWSKQLWKETTSWWPSPLQLTSHQELLVSLRKLRGKKPWKQLTCAIYIAGIYHIWSARNQKKFRGKFIPPIAAYKLLKDQIVQRFLFIAHHTKSYSAYIEKILA